MKPELTCPLVQDLLPSYVDGLTSQETNEAVEAHLAHCPECSQIRDAMMTPEQRRKTDTRLVDFLKKQRRRTILYILLSVLLLCAVFAILSVAVRHMIEVETTVQSMDYTPDSSLTSTTFQFEDGSWFDKRTDENGTVRQVAYYLDEKDEAPSAYVQYDSKGNLIKQFGHQGSTMKSTLTREYYTYDNDGRVLTYLYKTDDEITILHEYTYDDSGRITRRKWREYADHGEERYTYSDGETIIETDQGDTLAYTDVIHYTDGQEIGLERYDAKGQLMQEQSTVYSEDGLTSTTTIRDLETGSTTVRTHSARPDGQDLREEWDTDGQTTYLAEWSYSNAGLCTRYYTVNYPANDYQAPQERTEIYEYDAQNREILHTATEHAANAYESDCIISTETTYIAAECAQSVTTIDGAPDSHDYSLGDWLTVSFYDN